MKWTMLAFIAGAALSWGVYVPVVHEATAKLGSNLRAFLMVGLAYFLTAVLIPGVFIFILKSDPTVKAGTTPNWLTPNMMWGLAAGIAGAAGALCVIFAVKEAGPGGAIYVAPLVFAGAPIINTIASMTVFAHGKKSATPSPWFFLGILMAAGGAALVMLNKPKPVTAESAVPAAAQTPESSRPG